MTSLCRCIDPIGHFVAHNCDKYSHYKKKRKLLKWFFEGKNYWFSKWFYIRALSFNKDLYIRVSWKVWLWVPFWDWTSKIMTISPKIPKKNFIVKFHFESVFLDLANKKNSKQFKFCEIGGFTGILNKLIFLKIISDFENSLFLIFSFNWRAFCDNLKKSLYHTLPFNAYPWFKFTTDSRNLRFIE